MSTMTEHPLGTGRAMDGMNCDNKLQFIVDIDATKASVAEEVETRYEVSVVDVNTQITPQATKKATVRLGDDDDAQEVASRIGVF